MKFTNEVRAAIAVLRTAAENDFERHRIDVLERDLTAPPTVEVIDDKHQKFDGVTYRKQSNRKTRVCGHFVASVGIQRAIWSYYYGEIPDGYSIHHVDEDKNNNAIDNLQCLSNEEHAHMHYSKGKPVAENIKRIFTCQVCGKEYEAVDVGLNRYCSVECRDKARATRRYEKRVCAICGKIFLTYRDRKAKTCSAACAAKLRLLNRKKSRE